MRSLCPTDVWVRRLLVPTIVFIALVSDRGYLADFWHHLARGRAIAAEVALVDTDRFTFTVSGQSFRDVNWLSQLTYHGLFEVGGLELVQIANALLLAATFALLIELCRRVSGSLFWASLIGAGVFVGSWHVLTIRPQTFSLLLFVLLLDLLERAQRKPILLLLAPPILALWTNLHGAFPAGLLLVGCHVLASFWGSVRKGAWLGDPHSRRLALCGIACVLATLANPYGWGIYLYVGNTSNRAAARGIDEWLPPTLDLWIGKALVISVLVAALLLVLAWRKVYRPSARDVLVLGCFLLLGCSSARMVPWWLLVLAPLATQWLVLIVPRTDEASQPSLGAALTTGFLLLAAIFSLPGLDRHNPLLALRLKPRVEADLDAVHAHLRAHLATGRVFARFEWGEYLSWSASAFPIFMDGRIEIYPDDVWQQYSNVTCGLDDWQQILERHNVDALILDADYHGRTGLLDRVERSPHWRRIFSARDAILFVRA